MAGKVSIVIPVYNRLHLLGQTLDSAQRQSHIDLEIIVVDDSSTEDVRSFTEQAAARDSRVLYVHQSPNGGIGAARALGANRASGAYIQYLDSDDILHADKLRVQMERLDEQPELDFVVCQSVFFTLRPGDGFTVWNTFRGDPPLMQLCKGQIPWQVGAMLVRKEAHDRLGGFRPDLRSGEDRELIMRWLSLGAQFRLDPYPLVYYRAASQGKASWSAPQERPVSLLMEGLLQLEAHGKLTEPLRSEVATSLVRLANRHWRAGDTKRAAQSLMEAAEASSAGQIADVCRAAAAKLSAETLGEADWDSLRCAGYDWEARPPWWNRHRASAEGLLPIPSARRYRRSG